MSSAIVSISEPSICIPRVFQNIEKKTIWSVFTDLFGQEAIDRIDIVFKENERGEKFKRVFVHFKSWPSTYESQLVRRKLLNGDEVKIVYSDPWFWKCSASKVEKPATREYAAPSRPYVDLGSGTTHPRNREEKKYERTRVYNEPRHRIGTITDFVPSQILKRETQTQTQTQSKPNEKTTE